MSEKAKEYKAKRKNNFSVEFSNGINIPSWIVESISLPKYSINQQYGWEDVEFSFFDTVEFNLSKELIKIKDLIKERKNDNDSFFSIKIKMFNNDLTNIVESWLIIVKDVVKIDFGHLELLNNTINKLSMIVKPKDCVLL